MDIIFNPPQNNENKYVDIMVSALRLAGFDVHPLDNIFSSWRHFRSVKLVHLNWFENLDDSSSWKAGISFLRKLTVLTAIKLSGKKLVWTMHNRVSHEKRMSYFSRLLTKMLITWSDAIIIHARQSGYLLEQDYPGIARKIVYIPHPDFTGVYGPVSSPSEKWRETPLSLLFIGAVKPYKNIELLIDVVATCGADVQLTIAGKPSSMEYQKLIEKHAAKAGNVSLLLRFIQDDELPALLAHSDLLVLPYDLASSLNSGTVILAFSYKKTVICPKIGTLADMEEVLGDTFHYHYHTPDEHRAALKKQITSALSLKRENPEALSQKGVRLYHYIGEVNDKQEAGTDLAGVYKRLLVP